MVLKRHEDKPWEWVDSICFLKHHKQSDCDGVMELKDVNLKGGTFEVIREDGHTFPVHMDPYLEKIWVCNKCGHVFVE
ncbi:MAG: hypothetical protein KAX31_02590 [Thermoplasmata archaeon]|nr:hypothetical protein [Thermoplasmata archaeon]